MNVGFESDSSGKFVKFVQGEWVYGTLSTDGGARIFTPNSQGKPITLKDDDHSVKDLSQNQLLNWWLQNQSNGNLRDVLFLRKLVVEVLKAFEGEKFTLSRVQSKLKEIKVNLDLSQSQVEELAELLPSEHVGVEESATTKYWYSVAPIVKLSLLEKLLVLWNEDQSVSEAELKNFRHELKKESPTRFVGIVGLIAYVLKISDNFLNDEPWLYEKELLKLGDQADNFDSKLLSWLFTQPNKVPTWLLEDILFFKERDDFLLTLIQQNSKSSKDLEWFVELIKVAKQPSRLEVAGFQSQIFASKRSEPKVQIQPKNLETVVSVIAVNLEVISPRVKEAALDGLMARREPISGDVLNDAFVLFKNLMQQKAGFKNRETANWARNIFVKNSVGYSISDYLGDLEKSSEEIFSEFSFETILEMDASFSDLFGTLNKGKISQAIRRDPTLFNKVCEKLGYKIRNIGSAVEFLQVYYDAPPDYWRHLQIDLESKKANLASLDSRFANLVNENLSADIKELRELLVASEDEKNETLAQLKHLRVYVDETLVPNLRQLDEANTNQRRELERAQSEWSARNSAVAISGVMDIISVAFREFGALSRQELTQIQAEANIVAIMQSKGIRLIGKTGELVPFNPSIHENVSQEDAEFVQILEPGFWYENSGEEFVLARAKVAVP